MIVGLTIDEIKDIICNLQHFYSEGYLDYADPAFKALDKLIESTNEYEEIWK